MPATLRPRRSLLYMPGSNPRALEKARGLAADGLIFDLEDAVAPEAKDRARAIVAAALAEGGYGDRELVLRVNAIDTPWGHADLAAAAARARKAAKRRHGAARAQRRSKSIEREGRASHGCRRRRGGR